MIESHNTLVGYWTGDPRYSKAHAHAFIILILAFIIFITFSTILGTPSVQGVIHSQKEIFIAKIHYDATGEDEQNLNDEYIVIINNGNATVDLSGWYLSIYSRRWYLPTVSRSSITFPENFFLRPDHTVTIHSGYGNANASHLYWNSDIELLKNDGDVIGLGNSEGFIIDEASWNPPSEGFVRIFKIISERIYILFPDGQEKQLKMVGIENWLFWVYTHQELSNKEVILKYDKVAGNMSDGFLLAYIYLDGRNFNLELVKKAQVQIQMEDFEMRDVFVEAENIAREEGVGIWGVPILPPSGVNIAYVDFKEPSGDNYGVYNTPWDWDDVKLIPEEDLRALASEKLEHGPWPVPDELLKKVEERTRKIEVMNNIDFLNLIKEIDDELNLFQQTHDMNNDGYPDKNCLVDSLYIDPLIEKISKEKGIEVNAWVASARHENGGNHAFALFFNPFDNHLYVVDPAGGPYGALHRWEKSRYVEGAYGEDPLDYSTSMEYDKMCDSTRWRIESAKTQVTRQLLGALDSAYKYYPVWGRITFTGEHARYITNTLKNRGLDEQLRSEARKIISFNDNPQLKALYLVVSGSEEPSYFLVDSETFKKIHQKKDFDIEKHFKELTVLSSPSYEGSITLEPPGGIYNVGTNVSLTANPASGYYFVYWFGDLGDPVSGNSYNKSIILTMDSDRILNATFVRVEFEISDLNITPAEIESGEEITVSFTITNIDNQTFTYTVTMQIGELNLLIDIELGVYESKTISHTITPDTVGVFNVMVHGLTGSFTVKPHLIKPAEFEVTDIVITPEEVEPGMGVIISVLVTNVGEEKGGCPIGMNVTLEDMSWGVIKYCTIHPGESVTVESMFIFEYEGTYQVEVDGLTGSFTMKAPPKPAEFVVSNLEVDPDTVAKGEVVTITVEVKNIGETEGTHTVLLEVDGLVTELAEVTPEGGESTAATFAITEAVGDHTVRVGDLTGDFTVTPTVLVWWMRPGYVAVLIVVVAVGVIIFIRRPWSSWTKLEFEEKETPKEKPEEEEEEKLEEE